MLKKYDQFMYEYFAKKQPDFAVLSQADKEIVFEVALSYADLFTYILPHLNKNYFYDEVIVRGDFSYYPHYFLIKKENAQWFVTNCPILLDSFFKYCDWFSSDEGNLEARSCMVPNSIQKQYYQLLQEEADKTLSFMEFEQIIKNVIEACKEQEYVPEEVDGIIELIEESNYKKKEKQHLIDFVNSLNE